MTNIFSSATFSTYAGFLNPVANEWIGFSFLDAKNLMAQLSEQYDMSQTNFGKYVDFLKLIQFPDEANIFKIQFDESSCPQGVSYPIIRKSKDAVAYIIQIDTVSLDLRACRNIVNVAPAVLEVGEGQNKYQQAVFNITLPSQPTDTPDEYGIIARGFALKVDAVRIKDENKTNDLAIAFAKSPASAQTMELVATFKEGSFNRQLKELAFGDYKITSLDFAQREKVDDDGKARRWMVTLLTLETGEVVEASSGLRIVKPLCEFPTDIPFKSALTSRGYFWLRITGHSYERDKDGEITKTSIEGGIFATETAPAIVPASNAAKSKSQKKLSKNKDNFLPQLPTGSSASIASATGTTIETHAETVSANLVVEPNF